ncbi:MAG: carboxypeptidase regulatory-like domain-containing protein [Candidatus Hydrogenedentes bacterium]|nr:carboxypeptidase regulatory-like domain-containing protein [Candidatus Hydrogenedentota bacterium]
MRINGTLFVIFTLLALFWGFKLLFGIFLGAPTVPPGGGGNEAPVTKEDKIQALLSGEFKRQPKKNPAEGSGLLRCVVRDGDGAAVEGATLRVNPVDPTANPIEAEKEYPSYWEAASGENGVVEFRTLPQGDFLLLASKEKTHGLALVSVDERGAFSEAEVALRPIEVRKGEVTADGKPVPDARVVPIHAADFPDDSGPYRHLPVTTGADGTFTHPLLPAGAWQLLVSAPGYAPKLVSADESGIFRAVLERGEKLAGRVIRDEGERPVNNAKVELQAADHGGEVYRARANGQGYFNFDTLRPGEYTLRLAPGDLRAELNVSVSEQRPNAAPAATPLSRNMKIDPLTGTAVATDQSAMPTPGPGPVAAAPPVLQLRARPSGALRGRVLEAGADVGVPGAVIQLYPREGREPVAEAQTDQAGYYQFKSLAPGEYQAAADRSQGRVFVPEGGGAVGVREGGAQAGPVFREAPSVSLAGLVLDGDGRPVAEAILVVRIQNQPGASLTFGVDQSGQFLATGFNGADQVEIQAVRLGNESATFGPVTIGPSGLQDIMLRFPAS